jgi:hypothetical protein
MAKRKPGARKSKAAGRSRTRSSARKTARGGARKARKTTRKTARTSAARKSTARKSAARKATARRGGAARKRTARKATARKATARKTVARKRGSGTAMPVRTAPSLNRPRRVVGDEDLVPTPPSSLDMDRNASAVRTGRQEMRERRENLTQTSPALTGGDVDADWESAYSVGDEAPGGDNPTPDQDIVDDIGRAVGVEYEDNEELKGEEKIAKRDRKRWELDPASSEDYNDRD